LPTPTSTRQKQEVETASSGEVAPAEVEPTPVALVVNPDADARAELSKKLEDAGYAAVPLGSAEQALASFADTVDVVIAGVELPSMDGVELTRRLKDQVGKNAFLPVILLADEFDDEIRVRAFAAGCDDYLTQPISFFEIDSRLRFHLERRYQTAELARANQQLRDVQKKKKELAALMVHDLRNPLSALQGNITLLGQEIANTEDKARIILADCHELARKALSMVAGILDVEELEAGMLHVAPSQVILEDFIARVSRHHQVPIKVRELTLEIRIAEGLTADFDEELVGRVIENLLDNAVRYAPKGGLVVVEAAVVDGNLELAVGNDGPPVPVDDREHIFDRFFRIEARKEGARANRGLGLYFCQMVAEAHGGTIAVVEREELPATFELTLPQP
jgi:signal transduction histidine kinase